MMRIDSEPLSRAGEKTAGSAIGERGLSNAQRTRDQPGMVHPPRGECFDKLRFCGFMAEQHRVGTRMREGHAGRRSWRKRPPLYR